MADAVTQPTGEDPAAFLAAQPPGRAEEGAALDALFRRASGFSPEIWRGGIVGYGRYDCEYASGRSGTFLATGFAPRKSAISVYVMPGYAELGDILARLGPHRMGASCLTVTRLARIDLAVLEELVAAGLADLRARWPVRA